MKVIYISGSPRKKSNTDYLLEISLSITGGELIRLADHQIEFCTSCWACRKSGRCVIDDEMSNTLLPLLIESDAIVLGSPVYFNNVSAQLKAFIDRTWAIKGKLRNKIGGAIVVGRKYGAESAINAINSFFLKHEIIPANRGVCGIAYNSLEIVHDREAIFAAQSLAERLIELKDMMNLKEIK